jgi:hypothetical protein
MIPNMVTPDAKRSHKRTVKTGTTLELPHDFMKSPQLVAVATRNKIKPTALTAVISTLIETNKGDVTAVNLSYSSTNRYKLKAITSIADQIRDNWTPPATALIHWDGKLMNTLDNADKEERLPILLSGIGGIKLLGVPGLPHLSTERAGDLISEASIKLLDQWDCKESVVGMVFDTTSSNTGYLTGACIAIQRDLKKHLLWFACRHHIGEVILSHVWESLQIEVSKSPEVTIFTRFKDRWSQLTHSENSDLNFPPIEEDILLEKKVQIIGLCNKLLDKKFNNFVRCDYRELVDLTLLYLSGPDDKSSKFKGFIRPGALHKARWMAKILYSIKMVLLSKKINAELPRGSVFGSGQQVRIERFVRFCIFVYVPWWMTAPMPSDAPHNDLMLLNSLIQFSAIDQQCAAAAQKAFSVHLWYLTQEMVPLSLFSCQVTSDMKQKMATKLLNQSSEVI